MKSKFLKVSSLVISATLLLALTGCSSSEYDAMSEDELGGSLANSGKFREGDYGESALDAERNRRFADGSVPMAEGGAGEGNGMFHDVPFDYDSAGLSDTARQNIEYNYQVLEQNPSVKVQLEGHCDSRGTNDYNMALGDQRAKAVRDVLLSLGMQGSRLETISYGEELPLQKGESEGSWASNRRVHFSGYTLK
jgi:peptidoglycan-associated lipoprotein